jgi:glucokinase
VSAIGIDVGGTKCLAVKVDEAGHVLDELVTPSPVAGGILSTLIDIVARFPDVTSVGVGMPGAVSSDGVVAFAPHLPEVRDMHLRAELQQRLGLPVSVDNDATCAAIAEWKTGAGVGCDDLVMVTLGTGIGGGIIAGGRVLRGAHGYAGEFGHDTVQRDGHPCPCGRRGCWEQYASGTGLARLAGTGSGEEAFDAFVSGDTTAIAAMGEFVDWVVLGLVNVLNTCDPELFVLGGGLGSRPELLPLVRSRLAEAMPGHGHRRAPRVEAARLGPRAGALGAAMLCNLR